MRRKTWGKIGAIFAVFQNMSKLYHKVLKFQIRLCYKLREDKCRNFAPKNYVKVTCKQTTLKQHRVDSPLTRTQVTSTLKPPTKI